MTEANISLPFPVILSGTFIILLPSYIYEYPISHRIVYAKSRISSISLRDIGQNVLMANPYQQMFYSPYGDHSIQ